MSLIENNKEWLVQLYLDQEQKKNALRQLKQQEIISSLESGLSPVPDSVLHTLTTFPHADVNHILSHHSGARAIQHIDSLKTAYDTFKLCLSDLLESLAAFHDQSTNAAFFFPVNEPDALKVGKKVNKEIFATSCAAKVLRHYAIAVHKHTKPDDYAAQVSLLDLPSFREIFFFGTIAKNKLAAKKHRGTSRPNYRDIRHAKMLR